MTNSTTIGCGIYEKNVKEVEHTIILKISMQTKSNEKEENSILDVIQGERMFLSSTLKTTY